MQAPPANMHLNSAQFQDCGWRLWAAQCIQNGQFSLDRIGTCAGIATPSTGTAITAAVSSTLKTPLVTGATLGLSQVVASIMGIFTAHHAAAVAKEDTEECAGVAFVNNSMATLINGVQNGTIAPATAAQALPTIMSQFMTIVQPSWNLSPFCSANCELSIIVQGMVTYWTGVFNAMPNPTQLVNPVTGAVSSAAASTGLPSWLLWALGGFVVWQAVA
jgi:hypothetical protein